MSRGVESAWKGALVATLLLLVGVVAGVSADRIWLRHGVAAPAAASLTPEAMARALDLDPVQDARVRSVLDSLQVEVGQALQSGPDSLGTVARRARQRLEQALPADRRARFRDWMQEHHARMMDQMGGGAMGGGPGMGAGMMPAPDTPRNGVNGGMMMQGRDTTRDGGMGPGMMSPPDTGTAEGPGPGMMKVPAGAAEGAGHAGMMRRSRVIRPSTRGVGAGRLHVSTHDIAVTQS